MNVIRTIHSINLWLISLVGILTAIKFLVGWLAKSEFRPVDRGLMMAYTIFLDIQLLVGIILLINDGLAAYRVDHALLMIPALVLAHLSRIWRNKPDSVKLRNNFLAITIGLLVIVAGVAVLP